MPYIYSLGSGTHETGAPFMRGLFMDFGYDPNVADLGDEYMFGPALLIAPVAEQGATERQVYLPAGADWYNFWTNERFHGGQTITVSAPIDTIPLFVRAGSILPLGAGGKHKREAEVAHVLVLCRGRRALRSLSRRRKDLCLRKRRLRTDSPAVGRPVRQAHFDGSQGLDKA